MAVGIAAPTDPARRRLAGPDRAGLLMGRVFGPGSASPVRTPADRPLGNRHLVVVMMLVGPLKVVPISVGPIARAPWDGGGASKAGT